MPESPSGTVTLLFTDIEGSTRLQHRLGDRAYESLLAEHHRLLRAAITDHGGQEVNTAGDGFFAVFQSATDAVAAAAAAQRALAAHPWPMGVTVRVRMGLHTGQPQASGGRYVGLDVHRAARIEAAAHGNQVLLSQATATLVRDALPDNVSLRSLGEHQLKDLERPEALIQLVFADLPSEFPPPRTLAAGPPTAPGVAEPGGIYGRVFVGREAELGQLRAAYEAAVAGQGALVMAVGEPGVGKTALCEQLAAYVRTQGGRTLLGHCYEAGSLALPYLPFVEALRGYVLAREEASLRRELGTGAGYVARLVPEVTERVDIPAAAPGGDPEVERYRLLQALTGFLRAAAATQPLVVVLEDLHGADRGTLDLLTYLAHNLQGARLLLIGTYRDVEVDRAHPLSAALAELRRSSAFSRLLLRGLTAIEVQRMLSRIAEQEVSEDLAGAVHQETEGNPLFVQEVVRYLAEAGLIAREEGRWRATGGAPLTQSIPEGLRDVIGKRLSRLSPECNRLLSVAAVIGRDFDLATLQAVADLPEEVLLDGLEEAAHVSVLEERALIGGVRYRFTHALFRQTLYEELSAARRLRLHQQVARALERRYASRLEEHAAELAEHFAHSTDADDLAKAVHYGEAAARRAGAVYAYGEAARLLERALDVQEVLDPADTARRCDLLLALATAVNEAAEPRRVLDGPALQAFELAEALRDRARVSRACTEARWALTYEGAAPAFATPEAAAWAERAGRWARPDTLEEAWADLQAGMVRYMRRDWQSAAPLLTRALGLARRFGDPEAMWEAADYWMLCVTAPRHLEERFRLAEEMSTWPREGVRTGPLLQALFFQGSVFLERGDRGRAETVWQERAALAERTGQPFWQLQLTTDQGIVAILDGRLEDAVRLGKQTERRGAEIGIPQSSRTIRAMSSGRALVYLGETEDLGYLSTVYPNVQALRLAATGRAEDVWPLLDDLVVRRALVGTPEDETPAPRDYHFLEAAVLTGHAEAAALLLRRLGEHPLVVSNWWHPVCPARLLGAAAALLGDRERARRWSEQALADATRVRFRPEVALTHLQLAEQLADAGEGHRREAQKHLDLAITEFQDMKMQPSLERALALKRSLQA